MKRMNFKLHLRATPTEEWETSLIYSKQDIDEGATFARDVAYAFVTVSDPPNCHRRRTSEKNARGKGEL